MKMRTMFLSMFFVLFMGASVLADCGKIYIIPVPRPKPIPPMPQCPVPIPEVTPILPGGWNTVPQVPNFTLNLLNEINSSNNNNNASNAFANSGKIVGNHHKRKPGRPVEPPMGLSDEGSYPPSESDEEVPLPDASDFGDEANGDYIEQMDQYGSVPAPSSGANVSGLGFVEPNQQAVIAWNGKNNQEGEEILILTTNEKGLKFGGAMLSILPLPGKPISIKRANAQVFATAKTLMIDKWKAGATVGGLGAFMETKIGSHNIFVWEMENIDTFSKDVRAYVENKYKGKATALIDAKTIEVVKKYHANGFRYFAFDITMVDAKQVQTKEAIAYHFKSTFLYFPLVISQVGGTGQTQVDMVAFTPCELDIAVEKGKPLFDLRTRENPKGTLTLNGKGTVLVNSKEVAACDAALGKFTQGWKEIRARNFLLSGPINQFQSDFKMIAK